MNENQQEALRRHYDRQNERSRKQYRARRRQELRSRVIPVPALVTDTTWMKGSHNDDGFGDDTFAREIAYAKAKAAGITPSGRYVSQLADELGDPKAWVNTRSDAKRLVEGQGASCADLKVKARPIDEPDDWDKPYEVADDIVQEAVNAEIAGHHVGAQERSDLEESKRNQFSGRE